MNNQKIAFIICTNNDILLDECTLYLSQLYIPEGYETELITIKDAVSMTSGYNNGMKSTDAKYKVYMHQDVFILNRNFISDILDIFNSDCTIGMIGLIGYENVSVTGTMWHEQRYGIQKLYGMKQEYPLSTYASPRNAQIEYSLNTDGLTDVALIDGLMMITSCDIPWNESELKDWDYYDAFQSISFLEHGKRVVVPNQTYPWIIHDDGRILTMWNYNKYRKIFMKKYKQYLGLNSKQIRASVH